jgi:hypothetical protein
MKALSAACLTLLLSALAGPAMAKPVLAVSEVSLSDTSGTPATAVNAVWSRVRALTASLSTGLGAGYDVKQVKRADCDDYGAACLGKWAHGTGGDLVMIGTVLKMTPRVSHFWVGVFKPDGTTRLFYRDVTINGDDMGVWTRAGSDVAAAVLSAKLR